MRLGSPFRELDEQGYAILEDLLTPQQVDAAVNALRLTYDEDQAEDHELGTKQTFNLTARAEVFRGIIQLPRLVACTESRST